MVSSSTKCPYCGAGWVGRAISPAHVTRCRKANPTAIPTPQESPTSTSLRELKDDGGNVTVMYGMFSERTELIKRNPIETLNTQTSELIGLIQEYGEQAAQEIEEKQQLLTLAKSPDGSEPKWLFRTELANGTVGPYKPIYTLGPEQRAYFVSFAAHKGQRDKTGMPYFLHPQGVAKILVTLKEYEKLTPQQQKDAKAAAYLHDVLEDTNITDQDLLDMKFRPEVVEVVKALTAPKGMPKEEYYNQVKAAGPVAVAVKLADLGHNNLPARRAELPGSPTNPVQEGETDQYTKLGKKYAKAYQALGSDLPAHLQQFNN